jgi:two-component system response regulator
MMADRNPIKILIAEDDDEDFFLTEKALIQSSDCKVIRVLNGEDLLEAMKNMNGIFWEDSPPDIIVLDLNMPVMDGRKVLKALKSNPELVHIPVIVLTTSESGEDIESCYRLGVNSYIKKPVDFNEFRNSMQIFKKYWLETVELWK